MKYEVLTGREQKDLGVTDELWNFFIDFFTDEKALSDFSEILRNQRLYSENTELCSKNHKFLHLLLPNNFKIKFKNFFYFVENKVKTGELGRPGAEIIRKKPTCNLSVDGELIKITSEQKRIFNEYKKLREEEIEGHEITKRKIVIENLVEKILFILEIPREILEKDGFLNIIYNDKFRNTMGSLEEIPTNIGEWTKFRIEFNALLLFIDITIPVCKKFFIEIIVHEIVHIEHFQHNKLFQRLLENTMRKLGYKSFKCTNRTCINADPWIDGD